MQTTRILLWFPLILAVHFEDYQKEDARVKFLWATLENFSNEDRSRLIRFVTGRRRLPANMHIFWGLVRGVHRVYGHY